ncbi:MAG: PilZ domain-containing protein [Pseudomonadales bacterium]
MNNSEERRHFSRITFDGSTRISQGDTHWPATLIDISLKGLLIEEPPNWNAETDQSMEARIQLDQESTIAMTINWRHAKKGLVGFECENIDIDSIVHLRRLVELNLGNEKLLERELALLGRQ